MENWDPFLKFLSALVVFFTGMLTWLKAWSERKSKKERETDRIILLDKEIQSDFTKDMKERKINSEMLDLNFNRKELEEIQEMIKKSGNAFTLEHIKLVRNYCFFQCNKFNIDISSFNPRSYNYASLSGLFIWCVGFIHLTVGAMADSFSQDFSFLNYALILCLGTTLTGLLIMKICFPYFVALRIYKAINGIIKMP